AVKEAAAELGAEGYTHDDNVAKVSVVGLGMAEQTGVAQKMFRALAEADVNILMITTSEIKISVLVSRDQGQTALRTVHRVFELEKPPATLKAGEQRHSTEPAKDAVAVVARLQGMEDLTIDDISLDDTQARVTISDVPDSP